MKQIIKYGILFLIGGTIYTAIEMFYRGYSHISMFIVGGVCFVLIGLINEVLSWDTPLIYQGIIGGIIVTVIELITGLIVNVGLGLNVWDYSNIPFNLMGQISLSYSLRWILLSIIAIVLDDYLRYFLFNEEKPKYNYGFKEVSANEFAQR